jgi:hypothetical protein
VQLLHTAASVGTVRLGGLTIRVLGDPLVAIPEKCKNYIKQINAGLVNSLNCNEMVRVANLRVLSSSSANVAL